MTVFRVAGPGQIIFTIVYIMLSRVWKSNLAISS